MSRMSRRSLRTDNANGEQMTEAQYIIHARSGYRNLLEELEFRCRRAARINYHLAAGHDKKAHRLDIMLGFFDFSQKKRSAVTGTVTYYGGSQVLERHDSPGKAFSIYYRRPRPRQVAAVNLMVTWILANLIPYLFGADMATSSTAVVATIFTGLVYKPIKIGVDKVTPIFRSKTKEHVKAAAGWQFLELKIRAYKIRLMNPQSTGSDYDAWWDDIVKKRRKLCLVSIPEDVHDEYDKKYPVPICQ